MYGVPEGILLLVGFVFKLSIHRNDNDVMPLVANVGDVVFRHDSLLFGWLHRETYRNTSPLPPGISPPVRLDSLHITTLRRCTESEERAGKK